MTHRVCDRCATFRSIKHRVSDRHGTLRSIGHQAIQAFSELISMCCYQRPGSPQFAGIRANQSPNLGYLTLDQRTPAGFFASYTPSRKPLGKDHGFRDAEALELDWTAVIDLRAASPPELRGLDLVACNPPCARTRLNTGARGPVIWRAEEGGEDGNVYLPILFDFAEQLLDPSGRLIFVFTSTMDIPAAVALLNQHFPGRWWAAGHSPLAQPYIEADAPEAAELIRLRSTGRSLAWEERDGFLWRLQWILVAERGGTPGHGTGCLPFRPLGYELDAPDFLRWIGRFEADFGI